MRGDTQGASAGGLGATIAASAAFSDALRWSIDQVAELLPPSTRSKRPRLPWGPHAAENPPEYRYWLDHQPASPGGRTRPLPRVGPSVSVVIPVYKPELWYFDACIESVMTQSYETWEVCICDDGSADVSLQRRLRELAELDSPRKRFNVVQHDRNSGISNATNSALSMASGEFVAFVDHDDVLEPDALAEVAATIQDEPRLDVVYTDEDKVDEQDQRFHPHFKPDWAPELLLSYPYLGHLLVVRRSLLEDIGGFRPEFDGSQDFDVMLRATERARTIVHIPKVLYHWRAVAGSAAADTTAKPWAHTASRRAVEDAVKRRNIHGDVEEGPFPGAYHVRRKITGSPRVQIIIPFRDQVALTSRCLASLEKSPGYDNCHVTLVDNGSTEPETFAFRRHLAERPVPVQVAVQVLDYPGPFNWSAINNFAAESDDSDLVLFMNNDVEATGERWLHSMVALAQETEVGAVGARLLFPDGVVQHGGIIVGMGGIAGHLFCGMPPRSAGYFSWDKVTRPYSAVTGACMMTRREVFEELGGFDEDLQVAFNDVDFCLRLNDAGYRVLYTPHAELVHDESVSRGISGYVCDVKHFLGKWSRDRLREDPLYNPNLSLFATWCPLRGPGEIEQWETFIDGLIGVG